MNRWKQFIAAIGSQPQIFVIGPLLGKSFIPTGPAVYVDGGMQFRPLSDTGNFPSITIGDGDSTATGLDVTLPKDKNFSDLAFVLQNMPPTVRHVELLGFLGGRRDHELINYGEANLFLREKTQFTTVRFDDSIIAFSGGGLKLQIEGTFSVAVFEEAKVSITGACKYALSTPTKMSPASSLGLSNEGHGTVIIESTRPCFLFLS